MNIESEHYIIGALLQDNDCIDRIPHIEPKHFQDGSNRAYFAEIVKQLAAGDRVDVITVSMVVADSLVHLNSITSNTPGSSMLERHAGIIVDCWMRVQLSSLGNRLALSRDSQTPAIEIANECAAQMEAIVEQRDKSKPIILSESLGDYCEVIEGRMNGTIKLVSTGFPDLDDMLDGGFERGTVNILAGRPAMGKTAGALAVCRNVAAAGTALLLSMEMPKVQVNDRNIAALGRIPVSWLRRPTEDNTEYWNRMTSAFAKANELSMYIDDQAGANLIEIRAKARAVKRKAGLGLLVIDQLSFITGGSSENRSVEIGQYTRGLVAIAKELDCAVLLLAQLNRKCEERSNKRPIMSDLRDSGEIEQDAATIIFMYRDEVYNPDSMDKGMCEWNVAKARQGKVGTVGLCFIGAETRFESATRGWLPSAEKPQKGRGFN